MWGKNATMFDCKSFRAGLILGDSDNSGLPTGGKHPKKNIALQDMVFCQYLRNTIDELQEYVDKENPSPEQFIRHIFPEPSFTLPYTKKEERIIRDNFEYVQSYVADNSNPEWYNLSAIERIWKDPVHTPDFDNLDLLFHVGLGHLSAKPIKKNGRLYEYTELWTPGLADGFFHSFPANVIGVSCQHSTIEFLKKHGIEYDGSRFEHDASTPNNDKWRINERKIAYRWMCRHCQSFCKNPWSDLTREIKREKPTSKFGWACWIISLLIGSSIAAISFVFMEDYPLLLFLGIFSVFATTLGSAAWLREKGGYL